jgi:hypothetical protein
MKQDKAIFISQCSAFPYKNNEILILILPFKTAFYERFSAIPLCGDLIPIP